MKRDDFIAFLLTANKSGYADPNVKVSDAPDGGHEIVYEQGDTLFTDHWYGGNPFSGQEVITHNGKAIWAMQYRGGVPEDALVSHEDVFAFLKKALARCTADEPLRGPAEFLEGGWRYTNTWSHDLTEFNGHEEITFEGAIVHVTDYMGGLVDGGVFET